MKNLENYLFDRSQRIKKEEADKTREIGTKYQGEIQC